MIDFVDDGICTLLIGGRRHEGWLDIEIHRGIEQISGGVQLGVTEDLPGYLSLQPIYRGDSSQILLDDEPVITGFIDRVKPSFDAEKSSLVVTGRDKTEDLIDCSAVCKAGQWKGQSLAKIAHGLCAPFGVAVKIGDRAKAAASKALSSFAIEEGEKVFNALDRATRLAAVMMWADAWGNLIIDLPGTERATTPLIEGVNILTAAGEFSFEERYSKYIVKGHAESSDDYNGQDDNSHQVSGTAVDDVVTRYRPLIIMAEDQAKSATAKQRAEWEARVRAGRSNRATVTVPGWRQESGKLWMPGLRVPVTSPHLRVQGDMLITSCKWLRGEEKGCTTEIELADPRAMDLLAGVKAPGLKCKAKSGSHGLAHEKKTRKEKKKDNNDWGGL